MGYKYLCYYISHFSYCLHCPRETDNKNTGCASSPVIFFMFWINAFTKYKENKEKTSPIFRELLPWPISAIVTLIIYIYTKKVTFILIAVYSLVFLVLGAGNMFREK